MTRLSRAALTDLPADVAPPPAGAPAAGIVHLGLGAFHRAHQAVFTEDAMAADGGDWGIVGVSLRSPATRDALAPQDGLYSVLERDGAADRLRVVGCVVESLVAPEAPSTVLSRLADPATRIVTLTVTEKGYCHDPATGALRRDDPGIRHDLAHPGEPQTALGMVTSALDLRRRAGTAPFTVLCCDNLPANGRTVAGLLQAFAVALDPALGDWVAEQVACPCTMVDRIVPATTDADRASVARRLGAEDAWPVVTEPFKQWVIEDRFPTGRPAWETVGAELVADVAPFEEMKLRLLNGSHSTLAYLGYLAGHETVAGAMADPPFARLVGDLMRQESAPTLHMPPGVDVTGYIKALEDRFTNPGLQHRTWQIAMDGSQKLPQRLLGTVRDRLVAGQPISRLALGVAAWMRYVMGRDEAGNPIDVRDPLADRLRGLTDAASPDPAAIVRALLSVEAVFGRDLPASETFVGAVTQSLGEMLRNGASKTVERISIGQ